MGEGATHPSGASPQQATAVTMECDEEASALEDLIRMVGGGSGSASSGSSSRPTPLAVDADAENLLIVERSDLALLASIAERPKKRFERRSWEAARHARTCKKLKRAEAERDLEKLKAGNLSEN